MNFRISSAGMGVNSTRYWRRFIWIRRTGSKKSCIRVRKKIRTTVESAEQMTEGFFYTRHLYHLDVEARGVDSF